MTNYPTGPTRAAVMGRRLPGHEERDCLKVDLIEHESAIREISQSTHMKRHERATLALHCEGIRGVIDGMP